MTDKLHNAFDSISADDKLKEDTLDFIRRKTEGFTMEPEVEPEKAPQKKRLFPIRRIAALAACLAAVIIGAAGAQAYFTPTSALSIDINPSIQLDINRFDKVISAQGFNQAGQAILDQTDVKYMSYDEAIDAILSAAEEAGYLESSSNVSIAAAGESEQCGRLLTGAEECAGRHSGNVSCYSGTQEDLHCAHDYGMSLGRYNAYLILKELDPSVTPEQVQNMSMREIYDMIESLGGSAPSGSGSGGGQSGEGHHGHMGGHQ